MASSTDRKKPTGRDSVRNALIQSATILCAEKGPSLVSVREVAKHAGVNHGLVHRHFGSKEGLITEVMHRLANEVNTTLGPQRSDETLPELLPQLLGDRTRIGAHWRIIAHAILAGEDPTELQSEFPVFKRLVSAAENSLGPNCNPEAVATLLVSSGLGLMLFNPFLKAASGQNDADWERTRQGMYAMLVNAIKPAPSNSP